MALRYNLLIVIAAFCIISCDRGVYSRFDDDFPENRWNKATVMHHEFEISEAGKYNLELTFSHVYGPQFKDVPIKLEVSMPDGQLITEQVSLELLDSENRPLADCSGDYCDLTQIVISDRELKTGKYKVSISNEFQYDYLPNVLGVGLKLKKSDTQ